MYKITIPEQFLNIHLNYEIKSFGELSMGCAEVTSTQFGDLK